MPLPRAQDAHPRASVCCPRWQLGLVLIMLAACERTPPTAPAAGTPPSYPVAATGTAPRAATPCDLISLDELRQVFPGEVTRAPEHHAAFGISTCEWNGDFGRLLVQQWASKGHTPQDEVRDLVAGFIDPKSPGAAQRVRMVSPRGLGNYATAVVEARDPSAGLLADIAVLSIARNGQTLVFLTDALDEQQRDASLDKLVQLGHFAYARL